MPENHSPRTGLRIFAGFFAVIVLICAVSGGMVYHFLHSHGALPAQDVDITIMPKMSFTALAKDLQNQLVIENADHFILYARYQKVTDKLRSGRFRLNTSWNPPRVLEELINGLPLLERVTIPEGLTWWETGKRLEAAGLVRFADFEKVVHDPAFLRHWGIPFPSAEGFLFPDTYLIGRPLEMNENSARSVAGRLIDTFWRKTAPLWPDKTRPGPSNAGMVRDRVCLASIVEKETALPNERARVAGVYINRLQAGMRLQADPTVVYGLGPSFSGVLRRSQLNDSSNPYNTYQNAGLPPGPICSPSLASMNAAFHPEDHLYFYFVANGIGGHTFSVNLQEHNSAVQLYRQAQVNKTKLGIYEEKSQLQNKSQLEQSNQSNQAQNQSQPLEQNLELVPNSVPSVQN